MTVSRELPATAPPNTAAGYRPSRTPAEPDRTTSVRLGPRAEAEAWETPAVTSPGQVRTDTMAAPAPKPVSVTRHRSAPVFEEYPVTVSPEPTAATPSPTD